MLDPDAVLNSVVASLQSIPQLVSELGGPAIPATDSISGHYFFSGEETSLIRDVAQMRAPSIRVAYLDYIMGNYDGMTVWKHRLNIVIRARNAASNSTAMSAPRIWWMCMNLPISVPEIAPNIRSIDLVNGLLWLFETSVRHQQDEIGQDYLVGLMVFNEMGDAGPDGVNQLCLGPSAAKKTAINLVDAIMRLPEEQRRLVYEQLQKREGAS